MTRHPNPNSRAGSRQTPGPDSRQVSRPDSRPSSRPDSRQDATRDSWDHVAPWYDSLAADQGSEYHRAVVIPGVLRLLEVVKGMVVLDVACGQGAVARALHDAGASVVGVDLSPKLIDAARKRSPAGMKFLVGDARKLPDVGRRSFDAAVCVLAMQNIDPIEPVFDGVARVLRPGGHFIVVVNHPAFRIPRQSRWKLDEGRKLLLREVDGYLTPMKIPIDMRPFKRPGHAVTFTHHRSLQRYVEAATRSGMAIDALEEWPSHRTSQPGPMGKAESRARSEFPLFLALRAFKLPDVAWHTWDGSRARPSISADRQPD